METIKMEYHGYELEYLMQPGKQMNDEEILSLKSTMQSVAALAGKKFNYGVFDPSMTAAECRAYMTRANVCIMRDQGEAIGFICNIVLRETGTPIIHAGLVVIARNRGHNLMTFSYCWMSILQYRKFGRHYFTNISSTPSIVGSFGEQVAHVWPSHKGNQLKPPTKDYTRVLDVVEEEYIQKYFKSEGCVVDKRRFVLQSPSTEMGFETNMKKLSRHSNPEANYFCMFWLDYSKGEDLIQVGVMDWKTVAKFTLSVSYDAFKSFTSQLQSAPKAVAQKAA